MILTKDELLEVIAIKRECLETLYTGLVDVFESKNIEDENFFSRPVEREILHQEPCRISYQVSHPTVDNPKEHRKKITLMIAPEPDIKAGTKFVVTQNGKTEIYFKASEPKIYSDHQSIEIYKAQEDKELYA